MTNEDTKIFLEMMFHDDRDSIYFIGHKKDGKMTFQRGKLTDFQPEDFSGEDCYVSMNGFAGYRRKADSCRQINAIYFDLDCHNDRDDAIMRKWKVDRTYFFLEDAFRTGEIPPPNLICATGRGLSLFYILERSISCRLTNGECNKKVLYRYQKIREYLQNRLDAFLTQQQDMLTLDKSVADNSRIVRVPGTMNSKTGTMCEILLYSKKYYAFDDFELPEPKRKGNRGFTPKAKPEKPVHKSLQYIRMEEMQKLQHYRQGAGMECRENMCFLYYNAVTQIYDHETAVSMLADFNRNFQEPLEQKELDAIVTCSDSNENQGHRGYYKISQQWIIDHLHITQDEIDNLGLFAPMETGRAAEARMKREAKAARNAKILELAAAGMKRTEIAELCGVTKTTVQNVLKANQATRAYAKKSQKIYTLV